MAFIHYRTPAFFLTKEEKGEADQVFNVLTENFGKVEILGKGIRKIVSKLRSAAELFCLSEIEFIQGKNYKTLTDAILIEKFKNIKNDFQKLTLVYKITEIVNFLIGREEKDERVWNLLKTTFQKLNNSFLSSEQFFLLYFFFFWNLVSFLGYKPELYSCLVCQKKLLPEILWFLPQQGGIVCWRCLKNLPDLKELKIEEIKVETVKILRILCDENGGFLNRLRVEKNDLQNLETISSFYYNFLKEEFSYREEMQGQMLNVKC